MIDVQDISLSIKINNFKLSVPHLRVQASQIIGVVGNNGAGKTTFLRLLTDLLKPDSGEIKIEGKNIAHNNDWKQVTGVYLDEYSLIDFLTAREYLDFIGKLNAMTPEQVAVSLFKCKRFYKTETFSSNKYISEYSTGNKHILGIVGTLLSYPKLVLLDEPFANLDPSAQISLKQLIKDKNNENKTCFIISSHNLDHIIDISDRLLLFENGSIIYDAAVSDSLKSILFDYFS